LAEIKNSLRLGSTSTAHAVLEKAPLSYKAPDEALEDVEVDPKRKLFLIWFLQTRNWTR
jgi:hypothetical protein